MADLSNRGADRAPLSHVDPLRIARVERDAARRALRCALRDCRELEAELIEARAELRALRGEA